MTTAPWQRAHVAILEHGELPVRTHRRPPDPELDDDRPRGYVGCHTRNAAAKAVRREQIRALAAQGLGVQDICERMRLSDRCVETHLKAIHQENP